MAEYQDFISSLTGEEIEARLLAVPNKVDKEEGKGLSSNDYTGAEKAKLDGIEQNAEKNVNPDWNATSGKAQILNKPENLVTDANYVHTDNNYTNDDKQALAGAYTKPMDGIPVYDLSADVQISLGKANTALQPADLSDLTALTNRKAGMLVDTASGAIASFVPDSTIPDLLGVSVDIEPVQDLHGYDHPWPAGGGKNKLQVTATTQTINGVTFTVNSDGTINVSGTASSATTFTVHGYQNLSDYGVESGTTYMLSGTPSGLNGDAYIMLAVNGTGAEWRDTTGNGASFTPSDVTKQYRVLIIVSSGTTINAVFKPMICLASASNPTTYAPYSNECPISGWDAVDIMHSGADTGNPTTYTVQLGQTVYGGILDVTGGTMTVDRAIVTEDAFGNLSSELSHGGLHWVDVLSSYPTAISDGAISSILEQKNGNAGWGSMTPCFSINVNGFLARVYGNFTTIEEFKTQFANLQICYSLAAPVTIQLDPVTIAAIAGQTNNVWADAGDVTVEFAADIKAYIDSKIAAAVAAMS